MAALLQQNDLWQQKDSVTGFGQAFSLKEVTLSDLDVQGIIGVGYFGRIRLVNVKRHCQDGQTSFALKSMSKRKVVDCGLVDQIMLEKYILQRIEHPFVVKLVSSFHDEQSIHLLMEYVRGGDLSSILDTVGGRFTDDQARFYAVEAALAIGYLHSMNILHRDLKPDNVMVDDLGHIKLVDFGFAQIVEPQGKSWTICGNANYLAPEVVQSRGYGTEADWWSLGILVHELLDGYPPFCGEELDVIDKQFLRYFRQNTNSFCTFPRHFTANAQAALSRLLAYDPSERADLQELTSLDWFEGIPWCANTLLQSRPPFPLQKMPSDGAACRTYQEDSSKLAPLSEEEQKLFNEFGYRAWSTDVRLSSDTLQAMNSFQGQLGSHVSRKPQFNATPSTSLETESLSGRSDELCQWSRHSSGCMLPR
eukprot:gnl/MRDRNA2_/MRDRNA2_66970_c0_seq1.p1 gnl/MRDRNA2_/MRDRNA2_66970_c0~~gnl/MRDRNA2_/MRDRNA2_66970_c0_seq1.p1  ORF type:complete len:421 (+),score=66.08 gnl/MRDRNA2_/MRDRNA2_66970_c0_seq1:102-1364(+)